MILGVGTDIVQIERVENTLARLGDAFVKRILTPAEQEAFAAATAPHRLLAKRFAAKEALGKALGTGIGQGVSWQDIEVSHTALGAPYLILGGKASEHLQLLGATHHHLSIADEQDYATAFVIISQ